MVGNQISGLVYGGLTQNFSQSVFILFKASNSCPSHVHLIIQFKQFRVKPKIEETVSFLVVVIINLVKKKKKKDNNDEILVSFILFNIIIIIEVQCNNNWQTVL